jgi:hypothetical protein
MTAILERRESESLWGRFCNWTRESAFWQNDIANERKEQQRDL